MKEHDDKLTLQETEQLCRLYMDCRLTVLEETELEYLLGKLPYSSPIIDETRMLMGIAAKPKQIHKISHPKKWRRIVSLAVGMAASIALFIGVFFSLQDNPQSPDCYIIAYENGHRLSQQQAEAAVEASIEKAEALMKNAEAVERAELAKQAYLLNLSNPSK